jgi:hypothetical protein
MAPDIAETKVFQRSTDWEHWNVADRAQEK